ncbi:MAG TPA: preprotein translocase subunit SecE [Candidatus Kapabacteria bacterium]|nr:preprotein translocase subunit SecE [Candidatus Kapabacteria bacterium]
MAETTTLLTPPNSAIVEKKGLGAKLSSFFAEVSKETKKVTWPTREQLQEATIVTLVLVVVFSAFVFGVDKIFEVLLRLVYSI